MKQDVFSFPDGDMIVTRPNDTIYTHDRSFIVLQFTLSGGWIAADFTLNDKDTAEVLGTYHYPNYRHDGKVYWDFSDLIGRYIPTIGGSGVRLDLDVTLYDEDGTELATDHQEFDFNVWKGRTIAGRAHPCEREIRTYGSYFGQYYVDILNTDGSGYDEVNVQAIPNSTQRLTFKGYGGRVDGFTADDGGDRVVTLRHVCAPAGAVWLAYTNTDGCRRIIAAKPLTDEYKVTAAEYYATEEEVRETASRYVQAVRKDLKLGVPDVAYSEYLTDIELADDVVWSYEPDFDNIVDGWYPCAVKAVEYKRDGGRHNMTITITQQL